MVTHALQAVFMLVGKVCICGFCDVGKTVHRKGILRTGVRCAKPCMLHSFNKCNATVSNSRHEQNPFIEKPDVDYG